MTTNLENHTETDTGISIQHNNQHAIHMVINTKSRIPCKVESTSNTQIESILQGHRQIISKQVEEQQYLRIEPRSKN